MGTRTPALALLLVLAPLARGGEEPSPTARGLAWLAAHQADSGAWGTRHTYAVTGLACLAHLAASDDPFAAPCGEPLRRGLLYLVASQADGMFPAQGHTWIHGQGFATLALAEAHARLRADAPGLEREHLARIVANAAAAIARHQSESGGWWYQPGNPHQHEGSTTVCAVQALVAAARTGIEVDTAVLDRGFEYLKRCQNPDGGFDYKEGPGTGSMKEGTGAGVATLALMARFDYKVMVEGVRFLEELGPAAMGAERFPYYGWFYASMGLRLFGEEMGVAERTDPYLAAVRKELQAWQLEDGSWPQKSWMKDSGGEDGSYSTAFATLALAVPDGRLSIFRRATPDG